MTTRRSFLHGFDAGGRSRPPGRLALLCRSGGAARDHDHPVAAKRALRAILKADRICALEPARAARAFLERGFQTRGEWAIQAIKEAPYGHWREYDPEETLRFYALRLHEAGRVKGAPEKTLSEGTNWRFLTELEKELKG